jgi:hypothetical protein
MCLLATSANAANAALRIERFVVIGVVSGSPNTFARVISDPAN